MKLTNLTMTLLAAVPLVAAGCPGDDTSSNESSSGSTTDPMTSTSGATVVATGSGTADDTAGMESTGEEPWPEFECDGVDGVFDGNILIESAADLAMLDGISEVTRALVINDTDLTDLDALGCVTRVGEQLQIFGNDQLANVDGLVNITEIGGDFIFTENPMVTDFDGAQSLTRVTGSFSMNKNDGMVQVSGFDSLVGIETHITIRDNAVLTNIDGLKGLMLVGGRLAITANPMLCISSVDCVGAGITVPAVPGDDWTTQATDPSC